MKYRICCKAFDLEKAFEEYMIQNCFDDDESDSSVFDVDDFVKFITESESDQLYDHLSKHYPKGKACGDIDYYRAYSEFVEATRNAIRSCAESYQMRIEKQNKFGAEDNASVISGVDVLLGLLENEAQGTEFDAKIGGFIESSLIAFVSQSKWRYGFLNNDGTVMSQSLNPSEPWPPSAVPAVWFGLDDHKPIDKWTIKYGQEIDPNWFEYDSWLLLDYLVDNSDECFSVWYNAECCYSLPDMEAIIGECPIKFCSSDTIEQINEKFEAFFSGDEM